MLITRLFTFMNLQPSDEARQQGPLDLAHQCQPRNSPRPHCSFPSRTYSMSTWRHFIVPRTQHQTPTLQLLSFQVILSSTSLAESCNEIQLKVPENRPMLRLFLYQYVVTDHRLSRNPVREVTTLKLNRANCGSPLMLILTIKHFLYFKELSLTSQ